MKKVSSDITLYPVLGFTQGALCFTSGRPTHSSANSTSLGSIKLYCNYCAQTIHSYSPLSIARYSFIQPSELPCGVNGIAEASKWHQVDSNVNS